MTQTDTNMSTENYYAYCEAWCLIFKPSLAYDLMMFNSCVRKGIIFG